MRSERRDRLQRRLDLRGALLRETAQAGPDIINTAALVTFDFEGEREVLVVKMSWVIVREEGDWKIVNHHASSRAPLIAS